MVKETIIVNTYDNRFSVKRKFTKKNPTKLVTNVKMFPIFESGLGRKAEVTYRKRKKIKR